MTFKFGLPTLFEEGLVFDLIDFDLLRSIGKIERAERVQVIASYWRQVEYHYGISVVLTN